MIPQERISLDLPIIKKLLLKVIRHLIINGAVSAASMVRMVKTEQMEFLDLPVLMGNLPILGLLILTMLMVVICIKSRLMKRSILV